MNKQVNEFVKAHGIRVVDDNKRACRHRKINADFFNYQNDYNQINSIEPVKFETEQLYTVEIAESELERIADFESQVFNNMKGTGHYNLFETLMDQKREEARLRDQFPAVKKAYEQYSLMLSLAKTHQI
jgi:hypothetical protein